MLNTLKYHLKGMLGIVLALIFPTKRALVERYATIPWHYEPGFSKVEHWIRFGLFYRLGKQDNSELMDIHQNFWKNQLSNEYYRNTQNRFQDTFLPNFSRFIDVLDEQLTQGKIEQIVEIGTGDGQLLAHLAKRWPQRRCVGLDLSQDQIALNKAHYQLNNLEFSAGDAAELITQHEPKATLYLTGLGVFEYFQYDKLMALLDEIRSKHEGNMLFLTEPVYGDADLSQDFESYVYGDEQSFSHAYPHILKREGWQLLVNEQVQAIEHNWWVGIAKR